MAKAKYINGSKYPNAKMTVSNEMNPYAGPNVNKTSEVSTAQVAIPGPKVIDNLGKLCLKSKQTIHKRGAKNNVVE